jgi:hypothetical protein
MYFGCYNQNYSYLSKKTYIQAHTTYTPCSTLILVESHTCDVGPLTMYCTQIECDWIIWNWSMNEIVLWSVNVGDWTKDALSTHTHTIMINESQCTNPL